MHAFGQRYYQNKKRICIWTLAKYIFEFKRACNTISKFKSNINNGQNRA